MFKPKDKVVINHQLVGHSRSNLRMGDEGEVISYDPVKKTVTGTFHRETDPTFAPVTVTLPAKILALLGLDEGDCVELRDLARADEATLAIIKKHGLRNGDVGYAIGVYNPIPDAHKGFARIRFTKHAQGQEPIEAMLGFEYLTRHEEGV